MDAMVGTRILEMGFGTGLNAWLTLEEAQRQGRRVEYVAVEKYPVSEQIAATLGYTDDQRFGFMHSVAWGEWAQISPASTSPATPAFRLLKLQGDVAEMLETAPGVFDLVYWDAFAPDTQPELWTAKIFSRVAEKMVQGGVLVTYSAKGEVRRALQTAGFSVERLPGALGKRHMTKATKI